MPLEATPCTEQGGYAVPNVTHCHPDLCATGACCVTPTQCIDSLPIGLPMDEPACDTQGGTYVGGGNCSSGLPCPFQKLPEGYEFLELTGGLQPLNIKLPRINDCGEVIYSAHPQGGFAEEREIYLYDNGRFSQITKNNVRDDFADRNNDGVTAWIHEDPPDSFFFELVIDRGIDAGVLGEGLMGEINNNGQVVGRILGDDETCTTESPIILYDGEKLEILFEDGLSNQGACLNDAGQVVWIRLDFCVTTGFTSEIAFYSDGQVTFLPSDGSQPQAAEINNLGIVAASDRPNVSLWQGGSKIFSIPGEGSPDLNDSADLTFSSNNHWTTVWEVRLYRNGALHRLSPQSDIDDSIHNSAPSINNATEVVWWMARNAQVAPSGIRMLRKIRTGDMDLDGDVDRDDFAKFVQCYTGPGDFDRLCECRFADIDHDRDVDADDYALFLSNYTGPLEDCDDNGQSDFDDLLFGAALDCNRNGIPDSCDIASGTSLDSNSDGIPDDCVYDVPKPIWREIFPVWTNRFLTMVPRSEWGSVALRVTLTSLHHVDPPYTGGPTVAYSAFEGGVRWVGPPTQYVESSTGGVPFWTARLQCAPHYQVWEGIDLLHVTGAEVVPSSEYHVQAVSIGCTGREEDCPWMSEAVRIKTARWGDIVEPYNPPGTSVQPDLADVSSLVNKFRGTPDAPGKALAIIAPSDAYGDITPAALGVDVGFTHISACVDAFRGAPYPARPGRCATGDAPCAADSDCTGSNAPPCALACP
jgi:hypothetical protein